MRANRKAFTLTELVIVLAVIGILAAILIPVFSNVITTANAKSALSDARHAAEQYVMNVHDRKGAPETMVIAVYKGGSYWLFGYDRDASHNGNKLMISTKNPYSEKEFMKNEAVNSVMDKWSFNSKHPGEMPDNSGNTIYDAVQDGTFWLVPYYDNGAKVHDVRAIPSYDDEKYMLLNSAADTKIAGENDVNGSYADNGDELSAEGDILAYHGLLLPGTYSLDDSSIDTTGSDGTDYSTVKYTLSFLMGDPEFNPTEYGTRVPDTIEIAAGTTVYPSNYTITNVPDDYTYTWDRTQAFTMNRNITLTAQWIEKPVRTVTFNLGEGDSFDDTTKAAAKSAIEAAGFEWKETSSKIKIESGSKKLHDGENIDVMLAMKANKDGESFTGWQLDGGSIYNDSMTLRVTGDMTFTAVFSSDLVHVVIKPNNGGLNSNIQQDVPAGSKIGLSLSSLGISAPAGKVFGYWSWDVSGTQFGDGAEVQVTADVTFTAHWTEDELKVQYLTDVPGKASSANIAAAVPAEVTYTSANKPDLLVVGGAKLTWYTTSEYSVLLPNGGSQTVAEGAGVDISDISSGTIIITPKYTAMKVTIRYSNGGYNVDNWSSLVPSETTYDLIDIRNGYTLCTNSLTCNEGYKFEGWIDTANADAYDYYQPGDTYAVTESLNGKTVRFVPYFNEEVMATACRIVFNFYDYQNYPMSEKADHVFFTYTSNVQFGMTLDGDLMEGNMPTKQELRDAGKQIIIRSAGGSEYEAELSYDWTAELNGDYMPITVDENTPQDTEVWIPTDASITINNEPYSIVTTADGFINIDHGTVIIDGEAGSPTMGNNFALANNITLSGNTAPLGFQGNNNPSTMWIFEGNFNGLGYTISGFHFNPSKNNDYVGLFSSTSADSVVENFKLEVDGTIKGYEFSGAVAGDNDGTIRNVVVDFAQDYSVSGWIIVGGICGRNGGLIENCHITTSGGGQKHVVARGYQVTGYQVSAYQEQNDEVIFGGGSNPEVSLTGAFIGGIAGGNDFGTITKCSVNNLGIHAEQAGVTGDYNGNSCVQWANHQGGIVGASVGGLIDQCWAYKAKVGMGHTVQDGNSLNFTDNISGMQSLGGIVGTCSLGTIQHCWAKGTEVAGCLALGGFAGLVTNNAQVRDSWAYLGSSANASGNGSYIGDFVSSNCVGASVSISGCAIWDAYKGNIPSGITNYDTLKEMNPANVGLDNSYYYANSNGPMLTANPYANTWTLA